MELPPHQWKTNGMRMSYLCVHGMAGPSCEDLVDGTALCNGIILFPVSVFSDRKYIQFSHEVWNELEFK